MTSPRPLRRSSHARAVGVGLVVLVFVSPLLLMVVGSLRTPGLPPPDGFDLLPVPPRWTNYLDVFRVVPLADQLLNSLFVVVVAVPVTVLVASWAAFTAVTGGRRVRALVLGASVVTLMIPASTLWVPRVVLFEYAGLTDHTLAVAAPALMGTTPFFVLLLVLAHHRVPPALFDAAAVEGLSPWRTWRTVAWPLTGPATVAVAALAFVFHWSNLLEPLLLLAREQTWPAALGLRTLAAYEPTFYPLLLAASVVVTVPAVVAFALVQRALFHRTLGA